MVSLPLLHLLQVRVKMKPSGSASVKCVILLLFILVCLKHLLVMSEAVVKI